MERDPSGVLAAGGEGGGDSSLLQTRRTFPAEQWACGSAQSFQTEVWLPSSQKTIFSCYPRRKSPWAGGSCGILSAPEPPLPPLSSFSKAHRRPSNLQEGKQQSSRSDRSPKPKGTGRCSGGAAGHTAPRLNKYFADRLQKKKSFFIPNILYLRSLCFGDC